MNKETNNDKEVIEADPQTHALLCEIDNIIDRMRTLRKQLETELEREFGAR